MEIKLKKGLNTMLGKMRRGAVLDVHEAFARKLIEAGWAVKIEDENTEVTNGTRN